MGMDAETGFVLHRTEMWTTLRAMLGAVAAIMRDHYVGMVRANRQLAPIPVRPTPELRRWRRRKR